MKPKTLVTALILLGVFGAAPSSAQQPSGGAPVSIRPSSANLNISPKRLSFDRNHRTGTIYIFNQGSTAATFDISLVDRVMMPDGQIVAEAEAQSKPEQKEVADRLKSAQAFLQVSPRRSTLNPGQGQTIRLRVAGAPDDATAVELRSHLTISTLPPRDSGTTAEAAAAAATGSNELRFQINALFGLSVPIIVRLNQVDVRAGIENASLSYEHLGPPKTPGPLTPILTFDLVRKGPNSLFGNIEVRPAGQLKGDPLGLARGVGVYTEIERRTMHVALSRAPTPGEHLEVTFTDDDTSPGKLLAKLAL